ncbi:Pentatricopeptide repeat-containing protein [Apostasia shenzhenica]|uniref:Pentatricopeptide repeat-containing protein n=1 Tax=Apostasia shenzhenica TaxID=1088818 RepID=A0A2I0BBE7_9ASPA|nr:Pentatricopeptide repeat-containing protein [Apostasia shenzhenica]
MPGRDRGEPDAARLHARLIKSGRTAAGSRFLCNRLISLYSRSPATISDALRLFHRLPSPNASSWTSIISALSGNPPSAAALFVSMLRRPSTPTQSSVSALLKILSSTPSNFPLGLQLHSLSLKLSLSSLPFSGSSLIGFYCRQCLPGDALKVFDEISRPDEVCFSAIIVGLAQNHRPANALSLLRDMRAGGLSSTMHSLSGALRAAAETAALEQTRIIHAHTFAAGLDLNPYVGTALVDAYGKAGLSQDALRIFDELSGCGGANLVTWNAALSAHAQHGDALSAKHLFDEMLELGLAPDEYTILALLTAYGNAGLVEETQSLLDAMGDLHAVEPALEHYSCLLGAMVRAGKLEEAERLALTMPIEPDAAVWRTLLSGCMNLRDADIGRTAACRLLELDPEDDSAYVMLANIYSAAGRKEETARLRKAMRERRVKKEGGRSWVEVMGAVHFFAAGDRRHVRTPEIYGKLEELVTEATKLGYDGEGEERVWQHSERLAVAFGLLSGGGAAEGRPLRVVKNLRICGDCHEFFKFLSRVVEKEIVVRDANRYHKFQEGACSCKDFW